MKALTVWQPWASLIAEAIKVYETRGRYLSYRGPIAIHAGKKLFAPHEDLTLWKTILKVMGKNETEWKEPPLYATTEAVLYHEQFPLGAIIATAELVECYLIGRDTLGTFISKKSSTTGDWVKYKYIKDKNELLFGDWTPGRYALEISNAQRLPEPVPARGQQGLWNWNGGEVS
jgi:hypothetical protein